MNIHVHVIVSFSSSDFVDALSKPLEYLSQAEKRAKQMQSMGIEEVGTSSLSSLVVSCSSECGLISRSWHLCP